LGLRAFMLRLRDIFVKQNGGAHINIRNTSLDSDFSMCNSPLTNGANPSLSKSFEDMVSVLDTTDFGTDEIYDESSINTVTNEEQV
jgi:hypothetical protein